jgi:hypothetical protein
MVKQKFGKKKGGKYNRRVVVFFLSQFCDVDKVAIIQKQL